MKGSTPMAIAAIALLSGISVACAADAGRSRADLASPAPSISRADPNDNLVLNPSEQKTAWQEISKFGINQPAPKGFTALVGDVVPGKLDVHPMPVSTANKLPILLPYEYALLDNNKLLIINPSDRKIADIITQ